MKKCHDPVKETYRLNKNKCTVTLKVASIGLSYHADG